MSTSYIFIDELCRLMEDISKHAVVHSIVLAVGLFNSCHIFIEERQWTSDVHINGRWRDVLHLIEFLLYLLVFDYSLRAHSSRHVLCQKVEVFNIVSAVYHQL